MVISVVYGGVTYEGKRSGQEMGNIVKGLSDSLESMSCLVLECISGEIVIFPRETLKRCVIKLSA